MVNHDFPYPYPRLFGSLWHTLPTLMPRTVAANGKHAERALFEGFSPRFHIGCFKFAIEGQEYAALSCELKFLSNLNGCLTCVNKT